MSAARKTTSNKKNSAALVAIEAIVSRILILRAQRTILDADLAALYGVTTKRLNEQVKRNRDRFPEDFMFRLTAPELQSLNRSQFATGSQRHRDPRFTPYAFTEHGAIMAATVLNSPRAVEVSIYVVRAFVQLRELLTGHKELAKRLDQLEARMERKLFTHDQAIVGILEAIRQLMAQPLNTRGTIDTLDCCHILSNITAGSGFQVQLLPTVAARGDECVTDPIYSIRHRVCDSP